MKKVFSKLLLLSLPFSSNIFSQIETISPPKDEYVDAIIKFITQNRDAQQLDDIEKNIKKYIDSIEKKEVLEDHIGTQGDTKRVPSDDEILEVFSTVVLAKIDNISLDIESISQQSFPHLCKLLHKIEKSIVERTKEDEELLEQIQCGVFKITIRRGIILVSIFTVLVTAIMLHDQNIEIIKNNDFMNWIFQHTVSKIKQSPDLALKITKSALNYSVENIELFWKYILSLNHVN